MNRVSTPTRLRPLLRWALLALTLGLFTSGAAGDTGLSLVMKRALRATAAGKLESARAELATLSQAEARRPQALLLQACIALEAGRLEEAARFTQALRELLPESPEPRVLEALLSVRREQPELAWHTAYVSAWKAAGRPNLQESPLLLDDADEASSGPSPEELWPRQHAPDTRVVLALASSLTEERVRLVLQHLPSIGDPALALAAHGRLSSETMPERLRPLASAALREHMTRLVAASPDSMQLRLTLLLEGTDAKAPYTPKELEELEAIAALPEWRTSDFAEFFDRLRHHLEVAGVESGSGWAFSLSVDMLAGVAPMRLRQRAQASLGVLPPAEQQRLAEALWRIGSRMAAESTLLERMIGTAIMQSSVGLHGDEAREETVATLREESRLGMEGWRQASAGRWPLHSLRESLFAANVSDEVAHMLSYLP